MASETIRKLAAERERHYLVCKAIVGGKDHDYGQRDLRLEALKEVADLYNYLNALGAYDFVIEVEDLGARMVVELGID